MEVSGHIHKPGALNPSRHTVDSYGRQLVGHDRHIVNLIYTKNYVKKNCIFSNAI
jgi:hypothetical protein